MLESINITQEEMAGLPLGVAGFLAFEGLCREKLGVLERRHNDQDDPMDARVSYLTNVINAADHYGVPGLSAINFDPAENFDIQDARAVARLIEKETSKLRFVALKERKAVAVVDEPQRQKVEHLISQLRERVAEATALDARKKVKLTKNSTNWLRCLPEGRSRAYKLPWS